MLNKTILSVIYYVPIIVLYFPLPFILFLSFGVGVVGTVERGGWDSWHMIGVILTIFLLQTPRLFNQL